MPSTLYRIFILAGFLFGAPSYLICQGHDTPTRIHTPAEIVKIMEDSPLSYELGEPYSPDAPLHAPIVLTNSFYVTEEPSGHVTAHNYQLAPEAKQLLDSAEALFGNNKPTEALVLYNRLKAIQPDFYHVWALIGDTYFMQGQFEQARDCFLEAIRLNFADFYAHWFLGDTYKKLGMSDSAITQLTIAHVLNINHATLADIMKRYRSNHGRPWDNWAFDPQFSITKQDNKIHVKASEEWLGYAMVKAVWKYEPGYAARMLGEDHVNTVASTSEEKEALLAYLATHESDKRLLKIVKDGFIDEFIFYEIIGPSYPMSIVVRQKADLLRIVEYVDRYH